MNRSHFKYLSEEEIKYRKLEAYINTGRTAGAVSGRLLALKKSEKSGIGGELLPVISATDGSNS